MPTATRTRMTQDAINKLIAQRVAEALETYEATKNPRTEIGVENEQQDNNVKANVNNGNGNEIRNGNPNVNNGGVVPVAKECTYQNFMKCQPLNFKGTKGVNSYKRTVGVDVAYAMTWKALMKLMTEVYCPRNEIQEMKIEFQELTLLCTKMVPEEEDQMEKYIGGLPDNIQGNVIADEPTRLQDAIHNHGQHQQPFKRKNVNGQNMARAYTAKNNAEKRGYARAFPYCNKCKLHHEGPCMVKCGNCKRVGHMTRDCKATVAATAQRLRNQNYRNKTGNRAGNNEVEAKAYAIGGGAGADKSFVSTTFSTLLDVIPSTLDTSYAIELADGRISKTNVILRGCTLGLLGHPFDIDFLPVELGSFDVIIGMDWLARHHAVIICDEKIVRVPYGDEVLVIEGDGCNGGSKSRLNIISCTKTQKYIQKGCQIYLAQVMAKKADEKSEEKRLKDMPIIQDFLEVLSEDFPGLPPARKVEFQIDLVLGVAPVARALYRLASSEVQ
ncbi:putative reverse transcriptase domain-containing protein [Tanacetum coccineum]